MALEDKEKIAFITNLGLFCYREMPFGLRNVRTTYQWLVNKVFEEQFGYNMEVYKDNMLIKSRKPQWWFGGDLHHLLMY